MKFLVVLTCALAVASAGHLLGPVGHAYAGPQHLPLINGEGVPVDTADVQHARAAHLSQKVTVHARNGDYAHGGGYGGHGAGIVAAHGVVGPSVAALAGPVGYAGHGLGVGYAGHGLGLGLGYAGHGAAAGYAAAGHGGYAGGHAVAHGPAAYPTTHVLPSTVNGVPLDTPEVAAATANHLAAHHEALARNAHGHHGGHYRKRRGIYGAAGLGYHGGAAGLGYHGGAAGLGYLGGAAGLGYHGGAAGLGYNGGAAHYAAQPIYHGPQHLPIINAEGVPVDTADVQHARAAHLSQTVNVQHRNGDFAYGGHGGGYYGDGHGGDGGHGGAWGHHY